MKQVLKRLGVVSWLSRVGLLDWLLEKKRSLSDPELRDLAATINQDYQACKAQLSTLSKAAPPGNPHQIALMISSFQTVWGVKLEGVFSLALRLQDFRPIIVDWSSWGWGRRYHKLFGNRHFQDFRQLLSPPPAEDPQFLEFLNNQPSVSDLLSLTYHQVDIGRIVLSNVMYRYKFAKFDLSQPDILTGMRSNLLQVQQNIIAAERLIEQINPAIALVMEKGLSPAAEIVGVCLARGIPVIQYVNSQDGNSFIFKRFTQENRHQHPFSLDGSTWEKVKQMDWGLHREIDLMQDLAESYKSGTWFNRKFLHQGKEIKSSEAVKQQLGLDPSKKTAVIFSHVLWDATFFYGECLFDDYETWLLQTVKAACANPNVNWVVKLHPDLVWKLKYEDYQGELRDLIAIKSEVGTKSDRLKVVLPDTDISTYSFMAISDYCLTVRGTIGIEMACHGVPVLTAGTGRYSNLGFTLDSDSSDQYLQRLAQIQDTPAMTPQEIELARRFAYTLFKKRSWQMQSFELVRKPFEQLGDVLDVNVVAHCDRLTDFATASDTRQFADWVASEEADFLTI